MNDMSAVIVPKSDQINADDLIAGPMTITIREVKIRGGEEQPVSIYFDDSDKAFRPCKSMSRVLVQAWGPDANKYVGRSLTLYRDPKVKWGGLEVGGIRISHMSDIDGEKLMMLTATKGQRKPFQVLPLVAAKSTGPTQADAIDELEKAAEQGTDALQTAWRLKWMAPFREALAADLERLKPIAAAKDAPDDRREDDTPDTNTNDVAAAKADEIIAAVKGVDNVPAVDRILAENQAHYDAFDDDTKMRIDIAASNHKTALDAKAEA